MAEPLTNIEEAGFYSQITESPSLFLVPGSTQVVGLIGTGKSTKSVASEIVRGSDKSDALSSSISSFNAASSNAIFHYPQSSFAAAHVGSSYSAPAAGMTLKVTVDGKSEETFTFVGGEALAAAVILINATAVRIKAEAAGAVLRLYTSGTGMDGLSFTIGSGTANTALGLAASARAKSIRWDPAITDPNFAPQSGETYQLSFETPKVAADFAPKGFFGLRQVVAEYGNVSTSSSLSLGAQGAFGNGATVVICRQLDPSAVTTGGTSYQDEIDAALTDMESQTISILVPMMSFVGTNVPTASFLNHVSKMSSTLERKERMAILAIDETAGRLATTGGTSWTSIMGNFAVSSGSGLSPKRIMVVNPGACATSSRGVSITTDGTYVAACLAGRMVSSAFDEAEPMTRKSLSTIDTLIVPELARSEKNVLTGLGVTVIEASSANILVRRAVTADGSSIASQEPSIVRAFDRVARELREALENRYVGTKILGTTGTALEAATETFLDRLIKDAIIGDKRNIKATQNSVEPRQFDISFEAVPIYPFLWSFIDISIVLK